MQTITLLNEKGGVGKTSQSIHLAAGLAIIGYRVLLLDTDSQANATLNFNVPAKDCLYRLMVQDEEWDSLLVDLYPEQWAGPYQTNGQLMLLPSHDGNRAVTMLVDDIDILAERLDELTTIVDYIIIDTPPTISLLHSMMYRASDHIIIPTEFGDFALAGILKTQTRIQKEASQRNALGLPPLHFLGIQPTRYRRTDAHNDGKRQATEVFGDLVWEKMHHLTAWENAVKNRTTLFVDAPGSDAELQAWGMVNRVYQLTVGETTNG